MTASRADILHLLLFFQSLLLLLLKKTFRAETLFFFLFCFFCCFHPKSLEFAPLAQSRRCLLNLLRCPDLRPRPMSLTPPWPPGCEQVQVLFLAGLRLSCLNLGPEVFGSASNPELGSSKPFGLVDGLKKPLLLLWIPGSCNCKTPEETYNSLLKRAKNLQQPTGRALVQTWSAARVPQGIHPHPATVMEAARTSSEECQITRVSLAVPRAPQRDSPSPMTRLSASTAQLSEHTQVVAAPALLDQSFRSLENDTMKNEKGRSTRLRRQTTVNSGGSEKSSGDGLNCSARGARTYSII